MTKDEMMRELEFLRTQLLEFKNEYKIKVNNVQKRLNRVDSSMEIAARVLHSRIDELQDQLEDSSTEPPVRPPADRPTDPPDRPTDPPKDPPIVGGGDRPDWFVTPEYILNVRTGVTYQTGNTGSNWNALAACLRYHARKSDRIGFTGTHRSLLICDGNLHRSDTVVWKNAQGEFENVEDIEIYGMDSSAKMLNGIAFFQQSKGIPKNIKFRDFDVIDCQQRPVITSNSFSEAYTGLHFENITFYTNPFTKWVFRMICAQFQIINCHTIGHIVEHKIYADNIQGDSSVIDCTMMDGSGRTFIQIVNRVARGLESFGDVTISGCNANHIGHEEGANAFSMQGHTRGNISIDDCTMAGMSGGGLVASAPSGGNTSYFDKDGFGVTGIKLTNSKFFQVVSPQFNRRIIDVRTTKLFQIDNCELSSTTHQGIWFDRVEGETPNGKMEFLSPNPATESMTWNVDKKVVAWPSGSQLTDEEINSMYLG